MNDQTKVKGVSLEDLQISVQDVLNKGGFGNIGTCTTAADTAAKTVTLGTIFSLVSGCSLLVKFTNGITSENSTLAITHTTLAGTTTTEAAKPIYLKGAPLEPDVVEAGAFITLYYNGNQFDIVGGAGEGAPNAVLVGDYSGTATYPEFDPMLDTVHTKAQTLTDAKKAQARANIGAGENYTVIKLEDITAESTFVKNSLIALDGKVYRAIDDTDNFPFPPVIDGDGKLVINTINGKSAITVSSETLDEDWELFIDCSNDYHVEEMKNDINKRTDNVVEQAFDAADEKTDFVTSRVRKTDFNLNDLKKAVAEQNLEKYGLKVGDQKTINGHTYVIAGLNCMKGTNIHTCKVNHVGLIVIPHTTQAWNASGNTSTGADGRGAGYLNSDLHYYIENTLLPLVETDIGVANLIGHSKLLSNSVDANAVNRSGGNYVGASNNWNQVANCKICALSEFQVYGGTVWSSSSFDTAEACRQLEVFQKYSHTEVFGDESPWLRDVASNSYAADAESIGYAGIRAVSNARYVAALILFH